MTKDCDIDYKTFFEHGFRINVTIERPDNSSSWMLSGIEVDLPNGGFLPLKSMSSGSFDNKEQAFLAGLREGKTMVGLA